MPTPVDRDTLCRAELCMFQKPKKLTKLTIRAEHVTSMRKRRWLLYFTPQGLHNASLENLAQQQHVCR